MYQNQRVRHALLAAVLLAGIFLVPAARAQSPAPNVSGRFLLVFDTSSDMKRCLPAVEKVLNEILMVGTNTQEHTGDSIGVWTFDEGGVRAGQYPLQRWQPDSAEIIAAGVIAFVGKQHYTKTTKFDELVPMLNEVVRRSERLTVLIFCDGYGEIHGTPYDIGINKIFNERQWERHRARLPIVIGLRSQRGQYTGCVVSFPPQRVSLPEFPPPPEANAVPTQVTNTPAPPEPPPATGKPLIIVGTTVTNQVPLPAPKPPPMPKPVLANPPPSTVVTSVPHPAATNEVKPPEETLLMQTNTAPVQPEIAAQPMTTTNTVVAPPPVGSPTGHHGILTLGVAFLAGGLAAFVLLRFRKPGGGGSGNGSMKKD